MEGLSARGQAVLKSFVTMDETHLRDAHQYFQSTERGSFIVVATTNNIDVLTDSEHRRHPVLRIPDGHQIDVDKLRAELPQLWAQAVNEMTRGLFRDSTVPSGYAVRLPRHLWEAANTDSAAHQQQGLFFEFLNNLLNESDPARIVGRVTGKSVWDLLNTHMGRVDTRAFTKTMAEVGWRKEDGRRREWGRWTTWARVENPPHIDARPVAAMSNDFSYLSSAHNTPRNGL